MKVVGLVGTVTGEKTRMVMDVVMDIVRKTYPDAETILLDLARLNVVFCDGRPYEKYEGDTKLLIDAILEADGLLIGTPVFQASIPGALKNVFDLLPPGALEGKVAAIVVTAGTAKHYLVAEYHLKPILVYLKAQIVSNFVFIEEKDFQQNKMNNEEVLKRLEQLVKEIGTCLKQRSWL